MLPGPGSIERLPNLMFYQDEPEGLGIVHFDML